MYRPVREEDDPGLTASESKKWPDFHLFLFIVLFPLERKPRYHIRSIFIRNESNLIWLNDAWLNDYGAIRFAAVILRKTVEQISLRSGI